LNSLTGTTAPFQFFDFRLLYVVIIGILFGLKPGLSASLLASFSCAIGYVVGNVPMYNLAILLPFAGYIITGAATGYLKDKNSQKIAQMTEHEKDLEKKYSFMNDIYISTLENKQQLKKQFIHYRQSFGRILEISNKLNATFPDLIFQNALMALEDILENQTISIYSINSNKNFGRLSVCSNHIIESAPRSIDLLQYANVVEHLQKNEVWMNTDSIADYPDYVFPLYNGEELALLVIIKTASIEQKAEYFSNLIKIICHFIEVSLLRAQQYTKKNKNELYLPASRILKQNVFKDVLRSRMQMEESAISNYKLISFDTNYSNMVSLANRLQQYLRESDVFGEGENGQLYIILSQASDNNVSIVLNRFRKAGIVFQNISDNGLGMAQ